MNLFISTIAFDTMVDNMSCIYHIHQIHIRTDHEVYNNHFLRNTAIYEYSYRPSILQPFQINYTIT